MHLMSGRSMAIFSAAYVMLFAVLAEGEKNKKPALWGLKPCQTPDQLRKSFQPTRGRGTWEERKQAEALILRWQGDGDDAVPRIAGAVYKYGTQDKVELLFKDETVASSTLSMIAQKFKMVRSNKRSNKDEGGREVWEHPVPVQGQWRSIGWFKWDFAGLGPGILVRLDSQCARR